MSAITMDAGEIRQETTSSMRTFLLIWSGQVTSWFGSELVQFALAWYLASQTGSASVLAFSMLMSIAPRVLVGPFAGALIDRWNRRIVMIAADGTTALATLLIAILYASGHIQVWHIYILMMVRAAGDVFHLPAMVASTQMLVPQKHLARVSGLNQALGGTAAIVCPPLGAVLLSKIPMQGIFSIDIITACLAIAPLLLVSIPQPSGTLRSPGLGFINTILLDLKDGFLFIWHWKGFRILVGIVLLLNLLAYPALALIPLLIKDGFHGSAFELAWFQSMLGIGSIAGGLVLGAWGGFRKRIVTLLLALVLNGVAIFLVGITPTNAFYFSLPAIFVAGFMNILINCAALAIMQAIVPPEKFGCVFSMQLSLAAATAPIGLAIAGPFGDTLGPRTWFLLFAVLAVAVGTAGFFLKDLMKIEDLEGIVDKRVTLIESHLL